MAGSGFIEAYFFLAVETAKWQIVFP